MFTLSSDAEVAREQVVGLITVLATFACADGDFDPSERDYIRDTIRRALEERYESHLTGPAAAITADAVTRLQAHFDEILDTTVTEIREMAAESVRSSEQAADFVQTRMKVKCFEVLQRFDLQGQEQLMSAAEALIRADGHVHAAEQDLSEELAALLAADRGMPPVTGPRERPPVVVAAPGEVDSSGPAPAFLQPLEVHYSANPRTLARQVKADLARAQRAKQKLEQMRAAGAGRLTGRTNVSELRGQAGFLDGFTHVAPAAPGHTYELTVLGDLHGCYSCLKAALVQSRFFQKLAAYQQRPKEVPKPLLVFLGDYIDRGFYGYDGIIRAVLETFLAAPDHVFVLRGNHEWYVDKQGKIGPAVWPAEAFGDLRPYVGEDFYRQFHALFETLPTILLFDRLCFVHAGVPTDKVIKGHYEDLSSLNKWPVRFFLMWGDPSPAAVIPTELQATPTARFAFGRLQAQGFIERLGAHTLIRGHEVIHEGFRRNYDDGPVLLYTVFSAGGAENGDLPPGSSYRRATPMALTVTVRDGQTWLQPWRIDYQRFNHAATNGFYAAPRELVPPTAS